MATAENTIAKITILHDMRPATDPKSLRYALGCVQVIPRDGGAYAVATNGMIAAACKVDGEASEAALIPPEVLPSKKTHWKSGAVDIEVNGECRASFGMYAPRPETTEGAPTRFPRVDQVFPAGVSEETHWAVSLDAELLRDLAVALGRVDEACFSESERSKKAITLFVAKNRNPKGYSTPIGVAGARGVGVIMPIGGPDGRTLSDTPEEYAEAVRQFQLAAERSRK